MKAQKVSLRELIALKKEASLAGTPAPVVGLAVGKPEAPELKPEAETKIELKPETASETFSLAIELNERQLLAKEYAFAGKSFCLVGAAGTGKTAAQREIAAALLSSGMLKQATFKDQESKKYIPAPSIAFVAFTRRASRNLERAIHKDPVLANEFSHNIMTIHALLEYQPETYLDPETGLERFRFAPRKTARNPLTITHLVIEEASMVGLDLWAALYDALPAGIQIIFIGDINQLRPIFGPSVLNSALVKLPIIELTQVYRQTEGSGILENAHRILRGELPVEFPDFKIIRGESKTHVGQHKQLLALSTFFTRLYNEGEYDPEQDIILSPFNKQDLGTDSLNKHIAQILGTHRNAEVHEVIAGFTKHYLAIGDRVMVNKMDGTITKITRNGQYQGMEPKAPSNTLSRFGVYTGAMKVEDFNDTEEGDGLLQYNESFQLLQDKEVELRKQQASHCIYIMLESGMEISLTQAGQFTPTVFSLGYCLTVHKAQGCEFRKVYFILHKAHAIMACRELFYTAVTRAREKFILIAKDDTIANAIKSQRIKGNSLEDKLEYFNSGQDMQFVEVTK